MKLIQLLESRPIEFYHGSPSGRMVPDHYGVHVGSLEAARQALNARIGIKADGTDWDGSSRYGETLLMGTKRMKDAGIWATGFNAGDPIRKTPEDDYYPGDRPMKAKYSDGTTVSEDERPIIFKVRIIGPMDQRMRGDNAANTAMRKAMLTKTPPDQGYYYKNRGEDDGSLAAVVPNANFLEVTP